MPCLLGLMLVTETTSLLIATYNNDNFQNDFLTGLKCVFIRAEGCNSLCI